MGDAGEEAASLREAPLPQTPSPEERLAFEGRGFCWLGSACEVGALSDGLGCGHGERNPSARFAGTSPFRGGFLAPAPPKECHVRSTSFTRRTFPPLSTGPSLKTERFQRGRSCGTEGNPVWDAPARLHRRKPLVMRGVRGPARRMESSPAPGSLWFLSPAGKELVRPQTHETPSSHTPPPVCVPPPPHASFLPLYPPFSLILFQKEVTPSHASHHPPSKIPPPPPCPRRRTHAPFPAPQRLDRPRRTAFLGLSPHGSSAPSLPLAGAPPFPLPSRRRAHSPSSLCWVRDCFCCSLPPSFASSNSSDKPSPSSLPP